MNTINFFDLDTVTVTGEIEHGGKLEFPIRIERAATEGELLTDILKREQDARVKAAALIEEAQTLIARADSIATPSTQNVSEFIERVATSTGEIVGYLSGPQEDEASGATNKSKFKPRITDAVSAASELLERVPIWAESLLVTDEQAAAANQKAIDAAKGLREAQVMQTQELHRLKAERIAFWCPDWTAPRDGGDVAITADLLEKRSPEFLTLLEEEIEKKAPRRSVLL